MKLIHAVNTKAAGSHAPGNTFTLRLPPGFGMQLFPVLPTDVRLAAFFLPVAMTPSLDRAIAASHVSALPGSPHIELSTGQVLRYPSELVGRAIEVVVKDYLNPTWQGLDKATITVAVLEDSRLADACYDNPSSPSHRVDVPLVVGMFAGGYEGDGSGALAPLNNDVQTAALWAGDCDGRVCFHLDTTGAVAGGQTGVFMLQSAPDVMSSAKFKTLAWATTSLLAASEIHEVYEATHLYGPWVRWYFQWGGGAGVRSASISMHKLGGGRR